MSAVPVPRPGEVARTFVDGEPVSIWNVDGCLYAIGDVCPHRGWILSEGVLERRPGGAIAVVCPGHNWRFDLETGEALASPECLRLYDVQQRGDAVVVRPRDPLAPRGHDAERGNPDR